MTHNLTDLDDATDDQLAKLADEAFKTGLVHGREGGRTITADDLRDRICPDVRLRLFHKAKLRQVYGSGFDIARAMKRIKS